MVEKVGVRFICHVGSLDAKARSRAQNQSKFINEEKP
jgi:hypothetical protein